jgi:phospholipid transport system substrate-binding protein
MSVRKVIVPALALALLAVAPAHAASPTETLQAFFGNANTILRSADPLRGMDEARRAVRLLVDQVFDYKEASELVLGPLWPTRTPTEQTEFVRLFADFLERGFVAMIGSKASVAGGVHVQYLGESIEGESATVSTTVLTRSGGDMPVAYSMLRWGGRWMVRDVVIEGVSLIANYRAQFFRVIRSSSYAGLIARMRGEGEEAAQRERKYVVTIETVPVPPVPSSALPLGRASTSVSPLPVASIPVTPILEAPTLLTTAARSPAVEATPVAPTPPPTPAPVAAPPPVRSSMLAATSYWVQVGAFKTVDAATRVAAELRRAGLTAWNGAFTTPPGQAEPTLVRVRVGPYSSRADAQSKLHELVSRGYTPFIAEGPQPKSP